jgi:hypothetical protein
MTRAPWILMSLIVLLLAAPGARAQAPSLSAVPGDIRDPVRAQLIRQHADLVQQRESIAARVRAHNDRCSDVPEGSPAEAACATAQSQLSAVIAGYRAAVDAFNKAVASAPRAKP